MKEEKVYLLVFERVLEGAQLATNVDVYETEEDALAALDKAVEAHKTDKMWFGGKSFNEEEYPYQTDCGRKLKGVFLFTPDLASSADLSVYVKTIKGKKEGVGENKMVAYVLDYATDCVSEIELTQEERKMYEETEWDDFVEYLEDTYDFRAKDANVMVVPSYSVMRFKGKAEAE